MFYACHQPDRWTRSGPAVNASHTKAGRRPAVEKRVLPSERGLWHGRGASGAVRASRFLVSCPPIPRGYVILGAARQEEVQDPQPAPQSARSRRARSRRRRGDRFPVRAIGISHAARRRRRPTTQSDYLSEPPLLADMRFHKHHKGLAVRPARAGCQSNKTGPCGK